MFFSTEIVLLNNEYVNFKGRKLTSVHGQNLWGAAVQSVCYSKLDHEWLSLAVQSEVALSTAVVLPILDLPTAKCTIPGNVRNPNSSLIGVLGSFAAPPDACVEDVAPVLKTVVVFLWGEIFEEVMKARISLHPARPLSP